MSWRCDSAYCSGTHSQPDHVCPEAQGLWFCGRLRPPCPGHRRPGDACASGNWWQCGAVYCPKHSQHNHRCPSTSRWICGAEYCPKNHKPETRFFGSEITRCDEKAQIIPWYIVRGTYFLKWIDPVLRSPQARSIRFQIGSIHLNGETDFERVMESIENGRIQVRHDSALPGGIMRYRHLGNEMGFGTNPRNPVPTVQHEALLLHEAVHAVADSHGVSLRVEDDEVVAMIAQAMFLLLKHAYPRPDTAGLRGSLSLSFCRTRPSVQTCQETAGDLAAGIAQVILDRRQPTSQMLDALRLALRSHPMYQSTASQMRNYRGI